MEGYVQPRLGALPSFSALLVFVKLCGCGWVDDDRRQAVALEVVAWLEQQEVCVCVCLCVCGTPPPTETNWQGLQDPGARSWAGAPDLDPGAGLGVRGLGQGRQGASSWTHYRSNH